MFTKGPGLRAGKRGLRSQLAMGTAFVSLFAGYGGRMVQAGGCVIDGAPGTYLCSGAANAATDVSQEFITSAPLTLTTAPGFGLTVGGDALRLRGYGGVTFDDLGHNSPITTTGSSDRGFDVNNHVSGDLTITATGILNATSDGIYARNRAGTAATNISVGQVTAGSRGLRVRSDGNGPITITATGAINSVSTGVRAYTFLFPGDDRPDQASIDISTAAVTSTGNLSNGIYAQNSGLGHVNITATGAVAGAGNGIQASNYGAGLSIAVSDVAAGSGSGIVAEKDGGGDMIISAGQVSGGTSGVIARNHAGGDLTVSVTGVTAGSGTGHGILARNEGSGIVSISSSGLVSGRTGIAASSASNNDVTINGQDVSGVSSGIVADGRDIEITARDVTATDSYGITTDGRRITIEARDAAGRTNGVNAFSSGNTDPGATSRITTTGTASGTYNGVFTYAFGSDAAVDVSVNNAHGTFVAGVNATSRGTGTLNVTATGQVTGADGIRASTAYGSGDISVTVSGTVIGTGVVGGSGTGIGIFTATADGRTTTIALNDGASVSGVTGDAIFNNGGDSDTTVNSGASVTGSISLGGGADSLTFDGGNFSGVTKFDGGDGASDTLAFRNVTGTLDGDTAINWETVAIGTGGKISVSNALNAELVTVSGGGALGGDGTINGALAVQFGGSVGPGNSPGLLTVADDFSLDPGASLLMEVTGINPGEFDTLSVGGSLFLNGDIVFQTALDVTNQTFIDEFLVFDFIFGPTDDFDIAFFAGADYFLETVTATFDLFLQQDGSFELGRVAGPGRSVPEPGTAGLLGAGLLGLFGLARTRRKKRHCASTGSPTDGGL